MVEFECQRNNVTPKQFYSYCKREGIKRTGLNVEDWIDYEEWVNPSIPEPYQRFPHLDWEVPCLESYKFQPYETSLYLERSYNFILEFEFTDEKTGYGYCYIKQE